MAADTDTTDDLLLQATKPGKSLPIDMENKSRKSFSSDFATPSCNTAVFEPLVPALIPLGALSTGTKEGSSSSGNKRKKSEKKVKQSQAPVSLPQARIRTIMKSAPNVSFLSQDTVALTVKVAELFIRKVTIMSQEMMSKRSNASNELNYKDLANAVQSSTALGFLRDFLPHKVTIKEFQQKNGLKTAVVPNINDGPSPVIPSIKEFKQKNENKKTAVVSSMSNGPSSVTPSRTIPPFRNTSTPPILSSSSNHITGKHITSSNNSSTGTHTSSTSTSIPLPCNSVTPTARNTILTPNTYYIQEQPCNPSISNL